MSKAVGVAQLELRPDGFAPGSDWQDAHPAATLVDDDQCTR